MTPDRARGAAAARGQGAKPQQYRGYRKASAAPLRLALVGHPVAHSLSPRLMEAAGAATGLRVAYALVDATPSALAAEVSRLAASGYAGFNVTVPHKTAVAAHLDALTPEAARIGAVNTVFRRSGALVGDNTDARGFLEALGPLPGPRAVVLGAGGAARAVVDALVRAGVSELMVLSRNPAAAADLVAELAPAVGRAGGLDRADPALEGADLLVQATSAGLTGPAGWLTALPLERLAPAAVVMDLVYRPARTPLLVAASAAGLRALDGVGMLVAQGLASFERWTGLRAPPSPVAAAVRAALD